MRPLIVASMSPFGCLAAGFGAGLFFCGHFAGGVLTFNLGVMCIYGRGLLDSNAKEGERG